MPFVVGKEFYAVFHLIGSHFINRFSIFVVSLAGIPILIWNPDRNLTILKAVLGVTSPPSAYATQGSSFLGNNYPCIRSIYGNNR
jgi:hypothetical protein